MFKKPKTLYYRQTIGGGNAIYPLEVNSKAELETLLKSTLKGGDKIIEVKVVKKYKVVAHPLTLETE